MPMMGCGPRRNHDQAAGTRRVIMRTTAFTAVLMTCLGLYGGREYVSCPAFSAGSALLATGF